jgi:hypothetical protein
MIAVTFQSFEVESFDADRPCLYEALPCAEHHSRENQGDAAQPDDFEWWHVSSPILTPSLARKRDTKWARRRAKEGVTMTITVAAIISPARSP